jgi:hypothetical protein
MDSSGTPQPLPSPPRTKKKKLSIILNPQLWSLKKVGSRRKQTTTDRSSQSGGKTHHLGKESSV